MVRTQEAEGQNGSGEQKQGTELTAALLLPRLLRLLDRLRL
ncbi:MAG TPA: hypothetical protein VMU57_09750 [Edaphobacter sp.]|nr:hypothetical protein [Edaphobacter sp.]HUZ95183.1 hypothetical protein [Edaphobacter sp.]